MRSSSCPRANSSPERRVAGSAAPFQSFCRRWFLSNSLLAGILALVWLLLRTGPKPSRYAYPCQQAAMSAAVLAFGVPVVGALLAARRSIIRGLHKPGGIAIAALGLSLTVCVWGYSIRAQAYRGPLLDPPRDYRAQLFRVIDCPHEPLGDRFVGLDNLIMLMGHEGLKFYESPVVLPTAGPDGIIASDDVVIIKINYQWDQRGGTNTDLLRGLVRCILDHPDSFTGEIIVCENAQFNSVEDFDRINNNAEDTHLSPHDVVAGFQAQGATVSHYDWTAIRYTSVGEYSTGDMADGYIIYPLDTALGGRISYPKFQSDDGTFVSLRDGIWDQDSETYDRDRLKFINMPVLKSHHASYGATACVKNYMGVATRELSTNSHGAIAQGILGALMGQIRPADLNILDCIWINANPNDGPWTSYAGATRTDQLVAGVDPVAIDIWAVTNILIPAFVETGYAPPWPYPSADPSDPSSAFRNYLDHSMNYILLAEYESTNNLDQIDMFTRDGSGASGDFDEDGLVTSDDYLDFFDCMEGPGPVRKAEYPRTSEQCLWAFDFENDWDVDLADFAEFSIRFGSGDCNRNGILDEDDIAGGFSEDCNANDIPDECDIADATSEDCNRNEVPDECDLQGGTSKDCNHNGVPDDCDIAGDTSEDCNYNYIPDECDIANRVAIVDFLDPVIGYVDMSPIGTPLDLDDDECVAVAVPFASALFGDSAAYISNNGGVGFDTQDALLYENHTLPSLDAFGGAQALLPYWDDLDSDTGNVYVATVGVAPNRTFIVEWYNRPHWQGDSVLDGDEATFEIQVFETPTLGVHAQFLYLDTNFLDADLNHGASATIGYQADTTEAVQWSYDEYGAVHPAVVLSLVGVGCSNDCNDNGIPDECDIAGGSSDDCQPNGVPDECDIAAGTSHDQDSDAIPDECQ